MPKLDSGFLSSPQWGGLSAGARAALQGLLQFAIPRHAQWTIEGSSAQVSDWVGNESGLGRKAVHDGLIELEEAKLLKRSRFAGRNGYVIIAPVVED